MERLKFQPFVGESQEQDFGDEFSFEEDSGALKSILNNQGLSYSRTAPNNVATVNEATPKFTPAKNVPESYKQYENQFEFFESKGGHVFFRRKYTAGSSQKPQIASASKHINSGRSLGKSDSKMKPQKIKMIQKSTIGIASPSPSNMKVEKSRTPLAPHNPNTLRHPVLNIKSVATENKKVAKTTLPLHSFSEKKPKPGIPKPIIGENQARQSLYKKFDQKTLPPKFEPSIVKLTRESMAMIPRESMAWLSQLPRESATFAELERMMNENDKKFINDDDTYSFEALENRLRTPYKLKTREVEKENDPNNVSGIEPIEEPEEQNQDIQEIILSCESMLNEAAPVDEEQENLDDGVEDIAEKHNEIDSSPLRRCVSEIDLARDAHVHVLKCASVDDLSNVDHVSPMVSAQEVTNILDSLDSYQTQLEEFRSEQDRLDKLEKEILQKIKNRKLAFKEVWGVSPMSIRSKRTIIEPREDFKFKSFNLNDSHQTPVKQILDNQDDHERGPATEKKVRFNTEQNQTISMTPTKETDINDGEITPLSSHDKSKKLNKSRKSFDSLKCSLSFLKTPQTAGRQSRTTVETQHNVAQTPMALRNLSNRVMAEFAALYSDSCSEESPDITESFINKPSAKLNFN